VIVASYRFSVEDLESDKLRDKLEEEKYISIEEK